MNLLCVICLHVRKPGNEDEAVTVANGHATCRLHLDYVVGWPGLAEAIGIARGNEPPVEVR